MGSTTADILLHRLLDARRCPQPLGELRGRCRRTSRYGPAHVSPLLLGISPQDLGGSPLAMFQCTEFNERDVERLLKAINAVATAPLPESQVAARLRRTWVNLHDEIGRIDLRSSEDSEEEDATDDDTLIDSWLDEVEQRILADVAWSGGNYDLTAAAIAQSINENHVVTQHYVDQLVRRGFVYEKTYADYPATYYATPEGRRYLVEEDLV